PSRVNPVVNMVESKGRQGHVLENMRKRGWITAAEEQAALAEELRVYPLRDLLGDRVPYFTETVRAAVAERYSTRPPVPFGKDMPADPPEDGVVEPEPADWSFLERGLEVSLAVEPAAQRLAELSLQQALEALAKKQGWPGPL